MAAARSGAPAPPRQGSEWSVSPIPPRRARAPVTRRGAEERRS